jgi:Na+-transporting NADH:ubiquinone oxidoreductase subunit B
MFYGMYNVGYQANIAWRPADRCWQGRLAHGWLIGLAAGYDPNSIWDCFWQGACYFLPIYRDLHRRACWEILFAVDARA